MTASAARRAERVREQRRRDALRPVGTPLDDSTIAATYLVVSVTVPIELPAGPVALVLKRLEDDPGNYGVVDWELSLDAAKRYVADLAARHREWLGMRDGEAR